MLLRKKWGAIICPTARCLPIQFSRFDGIASLVMHVENDDTEVRGGSRL